MRSKMKVEDKHELSSVGMCGGSFIKEKPADTDALVATQRAKYFGLSLN